MLPNQKSIPFSSYSSLYDLIVPKNNKFRRLNELIDFTFVYDELKTKYCPDNGRMAEDPVRMFKYLLIKCISGLSDIDVVDKCMYDMSYKYFLGLSPESEVIEASTLCKFRRLRLKDTNLLDMLISKTVEIATKHGISLSNRIIVDSTHTEARSNPVIQAVALRKQAHLLIKTAKGIDASITDNMPADYSGDNLDKAMEYTSDLLRHIKGSHLYKDIPTVSEKANMLEEMADDISDHYTISVDPDARVGHKSRDTEFYGYKTHIAVTPEHIVVAAAMSSGEKNDGPFLPELISKAKRNIPELEEVIGDGAYSSTENLSRANAENITVVAKLNKAINAKREDLFTYNKDAGMMVCPAGHMAIRKSKASRVEKVKRNGGTDYFFDIMKCRVCKHNDLCGYKKGQETKTYRQTEPTEMQKKQYEYQQTDEFRDKYRERYIVEAKNSDLKNNYGMDRADGYGMESFKMQGALSIFSSNMMRIMRLLDANKAK